ncbi:hypothetical protein DRJ17_06400 [Candidatus Woesearchaeota archaeon]|nr:MAG: hypothetical protein DRJ17_06400 [Candidatus Woesearchaeota archaeon]
MEIETTNKCIYPNPIGMFEIEICGYDESIKSRIDNELTNIIFDFMKMSDEIYEMLSSIDVNIDDAIIKFDTLLGKRIQIYTIFKLSRKYDETIWLRLSTHDMIIKIDSNQIEIMIMIETFINEIDSVLLKVLPEKIEKVVNVLKSLYSMLYSY